MDNFTLRKVEFDSIRRILSRYCHCALGRSLAHRVNPSTNPKTVKLYLARTSEMVNAINDKGLPPFGGITDIRDSISRCHVGKGAAAEDFAVIGSSLEGAGFVKGYLNSLGENYPLLAELACQIEDFAPEIESIRKIVGADGEIRDDASNKLISIRKQKDQISREIRDVIHNFVRREEIAKLLQSTTVTVHGDRYVLPVKAENRGRLPGVVHRSSQTGATVFIEPNASVEMNNKLVDLNNDERAEIQRLINELCLMIAPRIEEINNTMRVVGRVDLLSAKAQYSNQFDMVCPDINETKGSHKLEFNQARHPLLMQQEFQAQQRGVPDEKRMKVVPIDVRLGIDFDLLVITGSNTGGKTVTLKTVALLVLMAQSGMHIPAQRGAIMPVMRDVLIDIGDEQSLQQSLSTFGAHIKRLRYIIRNTKPDTLVLLDELGSGTDPDEGAAIGQAVLDKLRQIGCSAMISTHLSVLKAYAMNHSRVDNASVEFDTETLKPTYHLMIGTPGESHAITVAMKLGLGRDLISSARKHLDRKGRQFRKALRATGAAREVAEQARAEATTARLEADDRKIEYETRITDLDKLREDFQGWLARLAMMQPGDEVFVPSIDKKCKLYRLELHKQVALVDNGNIQVEVPLTQLMPDFGHNAIRKQIEEFRLRIIDQAKEAEDSARQAADYRDQMKKLLSRHLKLATEFETWRQKIISVKVGDEVPVAIKPGFGIIETIDWPQMTATVKMKDQIQDIPLGKLFPQSGPFSEQELKRKKEKKLKKPLRHRNPYAKSAIRDKKKLIQANPGDEVYVIPFKKRAKLIRIENEKNKAFVQAGAFEMQVQISDLEPIG